MLSCYRLSDNYIPGRKCKEKKAFKTFKLKKKKFICYWHFFDSPLYILSIDYEAQTSFPKNPLSINDLKKLSRSDFRSNGVFENLDSIPLSISSELRSKHNCCQIKVATRFK